MRKKLVMGFLCALLMAQACVAGAIDYSELYSFQDRETSLSGYIDATGKIVEEAVWEVLPYFDEDTPYSAAMRDGRAGILKADGTWLLQPEWESAWMVNEDLFVVERDGQSALVRADGSEVCPFREGWIGGGTASVEAGLLTIGRKSEEEWGGRGGFRYGWIDLEGNEIVPPVWDGANPYRSDSGGVYVCIMEFRDGIRRYGVADAQGNVLIEPEYEESIWFRSHEAAPAKKGGKWGYLNGQGEVVVPFTLDGAEYFREGLARIQEGTKYYLIDPSGERKHGPFQDAGYMFSTDGQLKVKADGKWGMINAQGEYVIEPQFQELGDYFIEGLCPAKSGGKWGYIDETGVFVIEPKWSGDAGYFTGEYAVVQLGDGTYRAINKQGEYTMDDTWYALYGPTEDGLFTFKRDDSLRYGVARADGTIVIDSKWHSVALLGTGSERLIQVERDGAQHYYDRQGNLVFSWPQ